MSKLLSSAANLWPFINIHVSVAAGINTEHSSGLIIPAFSAPAHRNPPRAPALLQHYITTPRGVLSPQLH